MSRKEVPRPGLVKLALAGQITNQQGAAGSRLTVRQFQRVKARVRAEGLRGVLHRRRGQPSPRALGRALRTRVAALLQSVYRDVNDCYATEKLREVEGLSISRASVRRIRRALGLPAKHRRRPRQHRGRRTPAPRMGALVLLDGSQFAWLEDRGPTMTRLGAIDDASGTVVALHFRPPKTCTATSPSSGRSPRHGLPLALYGDRLNVFVRNDPHGRWRKSSRAPSIRPSSAASSTTSASATSRPARRRPRAASNGSGAPYRTASSSSSGSAASRPSRPPTPSSPPSSPISIAALPIRPPTPPRPGGGRPSPWPSC